MITLLTILHVVVCIFLIGIVLLQHGKGADIGATFGGSGNTVFGTDGPLPLLSKITTAAAIVFMLTSLTLAYNSAHKTSGSVMENINIVPQSVPQNQIDTLPLEAPLSRSSDASDAEPASATFPGADQAKDVPTTTPQEGEEPK